MLLSTRVMRAPFAALLGLALLAFAGSASAVERQHHFGLDGGLSMLKVDDKSTLDVGAGAGLHYTYGLTDQFNLVAEGMWSVVALKQQRDDATTPSTRPATVSNLGVGAVYVLDVLRYVPYFGLLGSGYLLNGGTLDKGLVVFGAQIALGLDYQFNRSWAAGFAIRQHMLLTQMSTYPTYTTMFARVEYMWGW